MALRKDPATIDYRNLWQSIPVAPKAKPTRVQFKDVRPVERTLTEDEKLFRGIKNFRINDYVDPLESRIAGAKLFQDPTLENTTWTVKPEDLTLTKPSPKVKAIKVKFVKKLTEEEKTKLYENKLAKVRSDADLFSQGWQPFPVNDFIDYSDPALTGLFNPMPDDNLSSAYEPVDASLLDVTDGDSDVDPNILSLLPILELLPSLEALGA